MDGERLMKPMDLYIAEMEAVDKSDNKYSRPVLVVAFSASTMTIFKITSQYKKKPPQVKSKYYPIKEWEKAGLKQQSYVDTIKTYEMDKKIIMKRQPIGRLTSSDARNLFKFIEQ